MLLTFQSESEYSMLLAVPCGQNACDVSIQMHALRTGFIQYLQQKQAAGIVNIHTQPGSTQVVHSVHLAIL